MTKRIFRSIFLVALAVFVAGVALIMGALYNYYSGVYEAQIQEEASYLSAAVEVQGLGYLENLERGAHRITWIAGDGAVLFDNAANEEKMENHADREEIREALEGGAGESQRVGEAYDVALERYEGLEVGDGDEEQGHGGRAQIYGRGDGEEQRGGVGVYRPLCGEQACVAQVLEEGCALAAGHARPQAVYDARDCYGDGRHEQRVEQCLYEHGLYDVEE